jgi:type I restriction enzyme S subunit
MSSKGWPMVPLGEVLTQVAREERVTPTRDYSLLGVRWYAKGLFVKESKPGSAIRADTLYRVEQGDFVYNRLFAWKGSFAAADGECHGCHVSNEFPCFTVDERRMLGKYLLYYLSRETSWTEALDLSSGGTPISRNRLKEAEFLAMSVPLPPRAEQDRIVARLDALAAKLEEARRLGGELLDEAQAMILSLHFSRTGERRVKVGQLVTLDEDQEPIRPDREYPQVGIRSFGGGLFAKPAVSGAATTYERFNRLASGMVVLSQVKGWEGAIAVCSDEFAGLFASPEYRTFRCIPDQCLPEYLSAIMATPWFHGLLATATRGQGARRERTRPEMFSEIELPMPTVPEQRRLVPAFQRLQMLPVLQYCTAANLEALMPAALDRAFRGEF